MSDLRNNLAYFSDLTQRTLSAFHISGTDVSLVEEINELRRYLNKYKKRILVTIEQIDTNSFKRIFHDGYTDIVDLQNIKKDSFYVDEISEVIEKSLSISLNPIVNIRYGDSIQTINRKKIKSISEFLFFIDMLDYKDSQDNL